MTASLQKFARLLAQSLQPLTGALSGSDAGLVAFVEKLGWTLPAVPPSLKALGTRAGQILTASQNLDVSLTLERNGGTVSADTAAQYLALATGVNDFLSALRSLSSGLQAELPPAFVASTDFPNQFSRRLLDYCLCRL